MVSPVAPPNTSRLRMQGVCKRFGATIALDGVDLRVTAGEVHALIGENGAGKSTLMKVLSGAHRPDQGHLWLDGESYEPRSPADGRQEGVAMIYQELSLSPHLSVMENIMLGVEPQWGPFINRRELRRLAMQAMLRIGRPDIALDRPVARLTVAEQQLVEIARSVASGCRVLVLDEPTSSLTRRDVAHLFDLVRALRDDGVAVVYISHVLEEVGEICDTFTVLRDGRVSGSGRVDDIDVTALISMMVGRDVDELYPRSERQRGEAVLVVDSLAGKDLPTSATLQLHRGEVLGIAGLIGAGRTQMLRAIFGLDSVARGDVRIGGISGAASPSQRWRQGVGYVSEDRAREGLAVSLSVADNLTMPRLEGLVSPRGQWVACRTWIDRMSIRCFSPGQSMNDLSGGNQQKVAIARLLHADVDVLLLDEPSRGIDVGAKAEIYQLIDELAAAGKAVLMVSSYLPELLGVCDRIAVMCRGVLGPARPVVELDEHRIMFEATGAGESAT